MYERIMNNKKLIIFLAISFLFLGIYGYVASPKQEFPEIDPPAAVITVIYPGASPSEMEREITRKVEMELLEVEGYDYAYSFSRNSASIVVLRTKVDADVEKTNNQLFQKMKALENDLPEGVTEVRVETDLVDTAGVFVVVTDALGRKTDLTDQAQALSDVIFELEGIAKVDLIGQVQNDVQITIDQKKIDQYQLTNSQLVDVVTNGLRKIPLGAFDGQEELQFTYLEDDISLDELGALPLYKPDPRSPALLVEEVATLSFVDDKGANLVSYQGKEGVLLAVYFKSEDNIIEVGENLTAALEAFEGDLPEGMEIFTPHYAPRYVEEAIDSFTSSLFQGIALVMVVVLLGMGFRNALVVSTAIPVTVMMSFFVMYVMKIKLHQISIAAMIISLGMIVDNAIVISDAIQVRLDEGAEKKEAALLGVKEVAIPVLTSTLTTIGAFLPLLLLSGVTGQYISSLPILLIVSLLASYLVSVFFTPVFAQRAFRPQAPGKQKKSRIRGMFVSVLSFFLRKKILAILLIIVLLGGAGLLAFLLPLQFFPYADRPVLYVNITSETISDVKVTSELVEEAIALLLEEEAVVDVLGISGNYLPKFYNTMDSGTPAPEHGQLMVTLDKDALVGQDYNEAITAYTAYLQHLLDSNLVRGVASVRILEQGEPIGAPVRIIVQGQDQEEVIKASNQLIDLLEGFDGTVDVHGDSSPSSLYFGVNIEAKEAAKAGILPINGYYELAIALGNITLEDQAIEGENRDIYFASSATSVKELEQTPIRSVTTNERVTLGEVGNLALTPERSVINRYERHYAVTILSGVAPGHTASEIEGQLKENMPVFEDITIKFDGELSKIVQYFGDIGILAIFALMIVFSILLIQFGSVKKVLIILFTIPLSAVGSLLGLYLSNQPLSFTSLMGVVSLLGIVVNNAIVLIDFITKEVEMGIELDKAIKEAVLKRFRPIMLTTITTVFGLVPLIFSKSPLFTPMAISLASGLAFATVLTLLVIPTIYSIVYMRKTDIINNGNDEHFQRLKEDLWKET